MMIDMWSVKFVIIDCWFLRVGIVCLEVSGETGG